jgi:peptidoglycan hydrolase CwlO-like protein
MSTVGMDQGAMTIEQMEARITLLSGEIDANEEENRMMQSEIDGLYERIEAQKECNKMEGAG